MLITLQSDTKELQEVWLTISGYQQKKQNDKLLRHFELPGIPENDFFT